MLTVQEVSVVEGVLEKVNENLSWNADYSEYRENSEDWILTLDKSEMMALRRALKKIGDCNRKERT